jgi:hypothetical protein
MHQRTLITRRTVYAAGWALAASAALALALSACGPGPTNGGPTPTGDISIAVTVIGDGRVTLAALGFDCSDTCTLVVDEGTDVSLVAVPNAGRVLVAWDGPCSPFDSTCAWEADDDVAVKVTFAPHALHFDLEGDGEGYFSIDVAGDLIECREACGVALQQPLLVGITYFSEGSRRTNLGPWDGSCSEATMSEIYCLVQVENTTTIGKTWRLWPRLSVEKVGGEGHVASDPPGIDCDVACSSDFEHFDFDTSVTLTAEAAPGNTFAGWTGIDCLGDNNDLECAFVIQQNEEVTANFTASTYTLNVTSNGAGNVTSSPGDIDLNAGTTSDTFTHDTSITLTASPATGNDFTSWSGVTCQDGNTTNPCTFTITSNTTVTATFTLKTYDLTVNTTGTGTGTVTPSSGTFNHGQQITLEANPAANSTFTSWSGVTCQDGNTTNPCTFTITSNTTIDAEFALKLLLVEVTASGLGNGNVTSEPEGIDLSDDADSASFDYGTEVTLSATEGDSHEFDAWTGVDCDGGNDGLDCTFEVVRNEIVNAAFSPAAP